MESQNIDLTLPIKFPYPVLSQLLEAQLIGTEIGSGERKRGKIVGLSLGASPLTEYDIVVGLQIALARKLLWSSEIPMLVHGSLDYSAETGKLSVGTFKLDLNSKNFLFDKTLEFLAHRVYYRKMLDRVAINVKELIAPKIGALNEKLQSSMPITPGIAAQGTMENITIVSIKAFSDHLMVDVRFKGGVELIVQEVPDIAVKPYN